MPKIHHQDAIRQVAHDAQVMADEEQRGFLFPLNLHQKIGDSRLYRHVNARIVVADEPVSALDVSVQAAVTDLLMESQREQKTTLLFISHDLSIVRYLSDRVLVMYLGHVVELGTTEQVFAPPYHPYTEALLSAVPIAYTRVQKRHIVLEGDIPY